MMLYVLVKSQLTKYLYAFYHFITQSKMWKEWKKNKCQPNFWNRVCLGTLVIFVFITRFFNSFILKYLFLDS